MMTREQAQNSLASGDDYSSYLKRLSQEKARQQSIAPKKIDVDYDHPSSYEPAGGFGNSGGELDT